MKNKGTHGIALWAEVCVLKSITKGDAESEQKLFPSNGLKFQSFKDLKDVDTRTTQFATDECTCQGLHSTLLNIQSK